MSVFWHGSGPIKWEVIVNFYKTNFSGQTMPPRNTQKVGPQSHVSHLVSIQYLFFSSPRNHPVLEIISKLLPKLNAACTPVKPVQSQHWLYLWTVFEKLQIQASWNTSGLRIIRRFGRKRSGIHVARFCVHARGIISPLNFVTQDQRFRRGSFDMC